MKRLLIAVALLATLPAFFYSARIGAQVTAESGVDALFEQLRASGIRASHGKVTFDAANRSLAIEDITIEPGSPSAGRIRIASLNAGGVVTLSAEHLAADSIDLARVDFTVTVCDGARSTRIVTEIPQIALKQVSAPIPSPSPASSASRPLQLVRDRIAAVSAASVTTPGLAVSIRMNTPAATPADDPTADQAQPRCARPGLHPDIAASPSLRPIDPPAQDFRVAASDLALENIREGRIELAKIWHLSLTGRFPDARLGEASKQRGELSDLAIRDFAVTPLLALLATDSGDDRSLSSIAAHLALSSLSATTEFVGSPTASTIRARSFILDNVAIQPSRLRRLITALNQNPSVEPEQDLADAVENVITGIAFDRLELAGAAFHSDPEGDGSIDRILCSNREFTVEGVTLSDARATPPVTLKRFNIRDIDLTRLPPWIRQNIRVAGGESPPSLEQALSILPAASGFEYQGLSVPLGDTGKTIDVTTLKLSWGAFQGSIPTRIEAAVAAGIPADPADPREARFIARGIDRYTFNSSLATTWSEGTSALTRGSLEIDKLLRIRFQLSLNNLSRSVFSGSPAEALIEAARIEAGAVEFSLSDAGLIDVFVAEHAREQNLSDDAARQGIIATIKASRATMSTPDNAAATDALVRFIAQPGQTLTVTLAPRRKLPVLALSPLLAASPAMAMELFQIEVSTKK